MEDVRYRIDKTLDIIPQDLYADGIVNLIGELSNNLERKLIQEGRWYGMPKSYVNSIWTALSEVCPEITDEEDEVYNRINYLFRKAIIQEYSRLVLKLRHSQGDAVIIIMHRILERMMPLFIGRPYYKKLKTVVKMVNKFFENIKNNTKNTEDLAILCNTIENLWKEGKVGKFTARKIELPDLRRELELLDALENPGERMDFGGNGCEISL